MKSIPIQAGQVYGKWTAITPDIPDKWGHKAWICRCVCGQEKRVLLNELRLKRSSGCRLCRTPKHGDARRKCAAPEYKSWSMMLSRCLNKNNRDYARYGGRGVTVCIQWQGENGYQEFLSCIGRRPTRKYEIDRINNDGSYEPGNVRWATRLQQNRNSSNVRLLYINGETKCVSEWAEFSGIPYRTILDRLHRGWPAEKAVFSGSSVTVEG